MRQNILHCPHWFLRLKFHLVVEFCKLSVFRSSWVSNPSSSSVSLLTTPTTIFGENGTFQNSFFLSKFRRLPDSILVRHPLNLQLAELVLTIFCNKTLGLIIDAQSFSNSFEGGTWGCEKIWEGGVLYFSLLLYFYDPIFQSLLRGYMRCPPLCVSMGLTQYFSTGVPWASQTVELRQFRLLFLYLKPFTYIYIFLMYWYWFCCLKL